MQYDENTVKKDIRDCNAYRELPLLLKQKGRRTMAIRRTRSGRNMDMMLQCRDAYIIRNKNMKRNHQIHVTTKSCEIMMRNR